MQNAILRTTEGSSGHILSLPLKLPDCTLLSLLQEDLMGGLQCRGWPHIQQVAGLEPGIPRLCQERLYLKLWGLLPASVDYSEMDGPMA